MYHEPFAPHGAENGQDNFWTNLPEGGDMLPGHMADDLYPTGHHAVQQDEYGTGIDPHSDGLAMPGDDPEQMPKIRAQGDGSGMADWDADAPDNAAGAGDSHLPGNYGRTAATAGDDTLNGEDCAHDGRKDENCGH